MSFSLESIASWDHLIIVEQLVALFLQQHLVVRLVLTLPAASVRREGFAEHVGLDHPNCTRRARPEQGRQAAAHPATCTSISLLSSRPP